jgi:site-specific DNA-methyltransferase (adenine-specific)
MMIVEQMLKNAPKPLLHIADVSGSALFLGDCLDIMPLIPDKSVQLILADLPYGTTACKWDSVLPFSKLWEQYERIIKPNGVIVLFGSEPFSSYLRMSNIKNYKYDWVWIKKKHNSGFAHAKNKPLKKNENICVFSFASMGHKVQLGNKRMNYNPQGLKSINKYRNNTTFQDASFGKRPSSRNTIQEFENYPNNLLYYDVEEKGKFKHPTQKPLELMKYLIKTYTNEGDMVLDNTMGSGTTCLAAKELNRKFIGIEKEANYYEIACRRCGF